MANKYLPTKSNLIKIRNSLKLSRQGQDLLEKKRIILMKEREKYDQAAKELKEKTNLLFVEGYKSLQNANIELGIDTIYKIAEGAKNEVDLDIKYKTIMGVEIPSVIEINLQDYNKFNYGLYSTTISLDKTIIVYRKIRDNLIKLAEIENIINRLNKSIKKVARRSNALKEIVIPQFEKNAKEIQSIIEERERDDFAKMKVSKKHILREEKI
jgi:V/A-type H+-transporting ATPase subunit D